MSLTHPFMCSRYKDAEDWYYGGATKDDAINAGLDLWGGEDPEGGFWVAPSHPTTDVEKEDGADYEFTVAPEKAEWIPIA